MDSSHARILGVAVVCLVALSGGANLTIVIRLTASWSRGGRAPESAGGATARRGRSAIRRCDVGQSSKNGRLYHASVCQTGAGHRAPPEGCPSGVDLAIALTAKLGGHTFR